MIGMVAFEPRIGGRQRRHRSGFLTREDEMLRHGQTGEQAWDLEGACKARGNATMWRRALDALAG